MVAESGAAAAVEARAALQASAVAVEAAGAAEVEARAAHQVSAVAVEAAQQVSAFQGGPVEPDLVYFLRAGMEQRGRPGILSATHRPGRDGVAQKIPDHNADPAGVHASKDTAGENSPSIEAVHDTKPAISEHTRFRV